MSRLSSTLCWPEPWARVPGPTFAETTFFPEIQAAIYPQNTAVTPRTGTVSYLASYCLRVHTPSVMSETEQLPGLEVPGETPEAICAGVAEKFGVRRTEIALLEVSGNVLRFLFPAQLKKVGAIPLSSPSVAARTARTGRSDLFNAFTRVKHLSVFEVVKIGESRADSEVIQKLMSAPIEDANGKIVGVIQVSRKAEHPSGAGEDFTSEDLRELESVAASIGRVMPKS
jgi:hypothetical protein